MTSASASGPRAIAPCSGPGTSSVQSSGGLFAGLPETCSHDSADNPVCTKTPIFIFAATGGLRVEPLPWLGVQLTVSLGLDSYPNPFGMVELGVTFALPLT